MANSGATAHPVIDGLRTRLVGSRSVEPFLQELEARVRQLVGNMVDGRVLPKQEVAELRAAMLDLVRGEALGAFAKRTPNASIRILDVLKAYGFTELEGERAALEAARASKFPPPPIPDWPELHELRAASRQHPAACTLGLPVKSSDFAQKLEDDGLALPPELLGVYAACDGFDLSCLASSDNLPVFSLLPVASIDIADAAEGYPRRAAVFQGGDGTDLSVCRDAQGQWWLVYEQEYAPLAKKPLDTRDLLRFALGRMRAAETALNGDAPWAWDPYFNLGSPVPERSPSRR